SHAYGAVLLNELLNKVSNNNTVAPIYTSKKLIEYSISENGTLINSSSYPITISMPVNLGANSSPSIMIFMYPTVEDGLIYNCINFEELKHNGSSWSSDQKFSAEDYIKLATKNSQSIILGTVIDLNPVGFAEPEFE
ncbi:MAG: hypothetical protein KC646_06960, partial [Candidatus Cloacimonetes bacterium]|nr:hypothetical protein [Candidatus Cloacimonadota bacterium]